jgi:hypothetical protein
VKYNWTRLGTDNFLGLEEPGALALFQWISFSSLDPDG